MYKDELQLKFEDFVFPYGKLNSSNEWVKLAQIISWRKIEEKYSKKFVNNGHPAKNVRMCALALLQKLSCTGKATKFARYLFQTRFLIY